MLTLREEDYAERERHRAAVRSSVAEDSPFDEAYVVMNVLATIVAFYGLLADSAAVVIGAMVIAMLLGPISGMGLALVDGNSPPSPEGFDRNRRRSRSYLGHSLGDRFFQ